MLTTSRSYAVSRFLVMVRSAPTGLDRFIVADMVLGLAILALFYKRF